MVSVTVIPFLVSLIWQRQREEDFVFVFINAAAMLFPLYFIKNHKIYFLLLFPLLLIPAFLDFGHIFLYQGRITESIFFIIFDTNPVESMEYVESNLSFSLVASVILYLTSMIIYWVKIIKMPKIEIETKWWKYLSLWILLPFIGKLAAEKGNLDKTLEAYRRANHMYSMVYNFMGYREQMDRFNAFDKKVKKDFVVKVKPNKPKEEIHVLVVGESTTKNKMSLYGYHRETTPLLKKQKKDLFIFEDVVSSTTGTLGNLKRIMTFANAEDESIEKFSANLVEVFKNADFKTFWVSNQLILGFHDTITSVFARQADKVTFTNTTNSTSYDKKVLPILDTYLKDSSPKKFIVIHLLGTHMIYKNRYPSEFDHFKQTNDIPKRPFHNKKKLSYINQYDNAILYHDHILNLILQRLKKENKYISLTYLSDHGEEVYDIKDFHGHPGSSKTINMYQIPFFIWLSDKYKKHEKMNLEDKLQRKYVSDDTIHTILDLAGVYPLEYIPYKSIVSDNFIKKDRYADKEDL